MLNARRPSFEPARAAPAAARVLELLIDYACAAKCPFCYNPPLTAKLLSERLTFKEASELLYRKRGEGYDGAWFTGGEPTQRPDLTRLLRLARRLGYARIQVGTNGWKTSELSYARALAEAGLNYAKVSIHGAGPAIHDRILGAKGSFAKAAASLDTLRSCGVAVGVNFVLCRWNLKELPAFAALAAQTWGARDLDLLFPHERGMMSLNAAAIGPSYAESAPWLARAFKIFRANGLGPAEVRLVNFPPCSVAAALRRYAVDWAHPDFAEHVVAHPEGSLETLAVMKSGQKSQGPRCAPCVLRGSCAGYESAYAARRGAAEFAPIRRKA